ncbi:GNAT family N-acetyltransferase [Streptomyces sp. NPDC001380]|uniref:GNAT family N-acetyltransferase n=1 Tax=Streptomyces sp. NPDC001380 TaxID=3364566 RepID=UPI0036C816DA
MSTDPLPVRARALWEGLASVPFPGTGGVRVAVSPRSQLCPPGWVGVVSLGGAAIVTVPDEDTAARARALADLPPEAVADVDAVRGVLPVARVLGPATPAYTSREEFRPVPPGSPTVHRLPSGHTDLRGLEEEAGEADAGEAGLEGATSPLFAVRAAGGVVAAAGYEVWQGRAAHIGVLTAPAWRGRGLARATGSAAAAHALAAGLLPQWRARIPASRRAAAALGFRELGVQLSVEPGPGRR